MNKKRKGFSKKLLIADYIIAVILVAVFFTVVALALASLSTVEKKREAAAIAEVSTQEAEQASLEKTEAAAEEGITVLEEALEKDAYPEVNNLIKQYFQALVEGDMETISKIKSFTDEEEEMKRKSDNFALAESLFDE